MSICGGTKKQPAATHVAAADEIRREPKPFAERGKQHIHVFASRDAAQEDHFKVRRKCSCEMASVAPKRFVIARIVQIDVDRGELPKVRQGYVCLRID